MLNFCLRLYGFLLSNGTSSQNSQEALNLGVSINRSHKPVFELYFCHLRWWGIIVESKTNTGLIFTRWKIVQIQCMYSSYDIGLADKPISRWKGTS